MPCIQVKVNFALTAQQKTDVVSQLSKLVAKLTCKPEFYVMVVLDDNSTISFGGDCTSKACFADLRSIGAINRSANKTYSSNICKLLNEKLGIETSRIYLNFQSYAGENWGHDGTTFG